MTTLLLPGATPTALSLPVGLSYEEWAAALHGLARMGKAVQFWIGDALKYGEDHYGEEMAQAASETGYSEESLRGFLWVSGTIDPRHRNKNLSWSHHQVVAGQDDPAKWLHLAETASWSVRELREAIKGPPKPKALCGHPECPLMRDD